MNVALLDTLTDPKLRTTEELKKHLVSKTSSGAPWLIAEVPAN